MTMGESLNLFNTHSFICKEERTTFFCGALLGKFEHHEQLEGESSFLNNEDRLVPVFCIFTSYIQWLHILAKSLQKDLLYIGDKLIAYREAKVLSPLYSIFTCTLPLSFCNQAQ